jgi:hypothetical protein
MRMSRKELTAELQKIRAYVKNAEREICRLGIFPRVAHKFPFDIVALATLSKAFAIARACVKLLAADCPDEAYGLSRSLVECATNLRYITAVPTEQDKRSRAFVKFALADKSFWYHHALQAAKSPKEKARLRSYAKQMGVADNPKVARQHWSGLGGGFVWRTTLLDHDLDGAATVAYRKTAYAVDYYLTSAFVHCSVPAIDNYFIDDGVPFRLSTSSGHHETYQSTLFVILTHVHEAIGYVFYGINTDRPARLDSLFQRTLKKMKPIPVSGKRKQHQQGPELR